MAQIETPRPLAFPVPFPEVPAFLVALNVPRKTALTLLGPPMVTDWVDGLGNADFWAFEFQCGLQVVYEFFHHSEGGAVLADKPEVDHVLRHIPFAERDCARIADAGLESELKRLLSAFPERQAEIDSLRSFQVWRQDDDGNPFKLGSATSERDAQCWVQRLQSLGHKQLYWYSRIGADPIA